MIFLVDELLTGSEQKIKDNSFIYLFDYHSLMYDKYLSELRHPPHL